MNGSQNNKFENLLVSIITAGFFIIIITPLLFSPDFYYPYVTPRNFLFRIIVEVQFLMWMVLIVKSKNYIPKLSRILLSASIFIFLITLSDLLGANPAKSIWGTLERMEGLVNLLHLFAFMVLGMSLLTNKKVWGKIAVFSLSVAVVVAGWSFKELVIDQRALVISTVGNSSYLGIYLVFHFLLSIYLILKSFNENRKYSFYLLVPAFLFIIVLYNTGARGSFLGLITGLFVSIIIYGARRNLLKIVGIVITCLFIAGAGLWGLRDTAFVKNNRTLTRIVDINGSSSVRLKLWKIAVKGIQERPILGWGQENFDLIYDRHYDTSLGDAEPWFDRSHNVILDWAVAGGILGALAYLSLFVMALYTNWKNEATKLEKSFIAGMLSALFVHNFFMFDYLISYLLLFFMLIFISIKNLDKEKEYLDKNKYFFGYALTGVLFCFLIYNLVRINPINLKTAYGIVEAMQLNQLGKKEKSIELLKEVTTYNSFGKDEAFDELGVLALSSDKEINAGEVLSFIDDNKNENPKTLRRSFVSFRLNALRNSSDLDKKFGEILTYSPKRQLIYRVMINSALEYHELEMALKLAKENYENDQNIKIARTLYALAALLNKDIKLSDSLMKGHTQEDSSFNEKFIQGYTDLGLSDHVINYYKEMIKINPDSSDLHTKLGFYYLSLDKKNEASIEFLKAQEMTQKRLSGH